MHSLFLSMPSNVKVVPVCLREDPLSDLALFMGVLGSPQKVDLVPSSLAGLFCNNAACSCLYGRAQWFSTEGRLSLILSGKLQQLTKHGFYADQSVFDGQVEGTPVRQHVVLPRWTKMTTNAPHVLYLLGVAPDLYEHMPHIVARKISTWNYKIWSNLLFHSWVRTVQVVCAEEAWSDSWMWADLSMKWTQTLCRNRDTAKEYRGALSIVMAHL